LTAVSVWLQWQCWSGSVLPVSVGVVLAWPVITCGRPTSWKRFRNIIPFAFALSFIKMVRSTIIVRASDALPLAASVDDEQVGCHSMNSLRCHSSLRAFVTIRPSKPYKSISSKRNCYSGVLHRTQNRVFPSRVVRIHTSMFCNSPALQT
jgi:hypothetical protein